MSLAIYHTLAALQNKLPSPINNETAYLTEVGRAGLFVFNSANLSYIASIDTQQGIYVKPAGTNGSAGVWVRQLPTPGEWHVDWFGVENDPAHGDGPSSGSSEILSHTQLTAVVTLANLEIMRPARIVFGAKFYTLGGSIPAWEYQVELVGSVGPQGTILVKRYVESSNVRGVLAFEDHGFTVRNITVKATWGSGGSGISAVLKTKTPPEVPKTNAGLSYIVDCYVSGEDHFSWSLYCNGASNTVLPTGYRGLYIRGGQFFGAKEASIALVCVQHFFFDGAYASNSPHETPGSNVNELVLQSAGTETNMNDDWQVHGVMAGRVNLNRLEHSVFVSPQYADIHVDANCKMVYWYGPKEPPAVVYNASGTGFVRA